MDNQVKHGASLDTVPSSVLSCCILQILAKVVGNLGTHTEKLHTVHNTQTLHGFDECQSTCFSVSVLATQQISQYNKKTSNKYNNNKKISPYKKYKTCSLQHFIRKQISTFTSHNHEVLGAWHPVRHLNITLNWYCGDSGMAQNTHRLTITTDIHQSIQLHPIAVGRTGESIAYDMGVFWRPSSGWVRPFPFLNSPRKLSWSWALWKPAPGLSSWPVVLQVAPFCSQSTGNSVSKAVPGRLPTWVSFRSCRETQLSQLRLVGISPTISQLSDSSQYRSIVSWYLRGSKFGQKCSTDNWHH